MMIPGESTGRNQQRISQTSELTKLGFAEQTNKCLWIAKLDRRSQSPIRSGAHLTQLAQQSV